MKNGLEYKKDGEVGFLKSGDNKIFFYDYDKKDVNGVNLDMFFFRTVDA